MVCASPEDNELNENRSEDNHQHRDGEKKNRIKRVLAHFEGYKGNSEAMVSKAINGLCFQRNRIFADK